MILISHRGNIFGPETDRENSPNYIVSAITNGFNCEIDLWVQSNGLYLGHDEPQYFIDSNFLHQHKDSLWIHCKNSRALAFCDSQNLHYFWHNTDDFTITSMGIIWAYPGKILESNKCIMVMPERVWSINELTHPRPLGYCSDFIGTIKAHQPK